MYLQFPSSVNLYKQTVLKILRSSTLLLNARPSITPIELRALDLLGNIISQNALIEQRIKFWLNYREQVSAYSICLYFKLIYYLLLHRLLWVLSSYEGYLHTYYIQQ